MVDPARVAADNPNSWLKKTFTGDRDHDRDAGQPDDRVALLQSRMVANPTVNGGGALILTSLAKARRRRAGDRLIIAQWRLGGRAARLPDPRPVRESHAQTAVLKAVMDLVGGDGRKFDAIELRCASPACPRWHGGRSALGPTCSDRDGRLTFFGAPLSTYMTHSACSDGAQAAAAAVRSACSTARAVSSPGITAWCCRARRRPRHSSRIPACRRRRIGIAATCPISPQKLRDKSKVEAFTVIYRANGEVELGVTMLRTEDGRRSSAASRQATRQR